MKHIILTFSIILIALAADAQIIKGTGILYFDSLTNVNASLPSGSEFAYSVKMKQFFRWDRDINEWVQAIEIPDTIAVFATQYYVDQLIQEVQDSLAASPSGSGTTNTIAMWTSPEELGNSIVTQPAADVVEVTGTGGLKIPVGTTAQRPAGVEGMLRRNTTLAAFEGYTGSAWLPFDQFWTVSGTGINPTTTSLELRLGGSGDNGNFILQGTGGYRFTTYSVITGSQVNARIFDVVNTHSGGIGMLAEGSLTGAVIRARDMNSPSLYLGQFTGMVGLGIVPAININSFNQPNGGSNDTHTWLTTGEGRSISWGYRRQTAIPDCDPGLNYTAGRIVPVVVQSNCDSVSTSMQVAVRTATTFTTLGYWDGRNGGRLGVKQANPTNTLHVAGDARIETVAENTTATKIAVLDANNVVGYRTFTPRAYAELYLDTTTDTIDITDTNLHTILFDATELSAGMTTTDSTSVATTAGVYEINFSSTWAFTENNKVGPATFALYVDDVEVGRGAMFSQHMHDNEEQIQSGHFTKKITLTATDVLKIKVSGGGVTNSIQIHSATFGAQKID